jgi:phosphate/sulfate permease
VLGTGEFLLTHYYQYQAINIAWLVLSGISLGYMAKTMPLGVRQMRRIFLAWFVPITVGMFISVAVFYLHNTWTAQMLAHLGTFG